MSLRSRPPRRAAGPGFSAWTFVAPVALVLAVVIAVSIVRAATHRASAPAATTTPTTTAPAATGSTTVPITTLPPKKRRYYRVKRGDTFESIEAALGLAPATLVQLNPKVDPLNIQPGQRLRIS